MFLLFVLLNEIWSCWQLSGDEEDDTYKSQIINVLQDIIEIITQDIMVNGHE